MGIEKDFNWDDLLYLIYEGRIEMTKQEEKIKKIQQSNDELILLLDIERRKNK